MKQKNNKIKKTIITLIIISMFILSFVAIAFNYKNQDTNKKVNTKLIDSKYCEEIFITKNITDITMAHKIYNSPNCFDIKEINNSYDVHCCKNQYVKKI